MYTNESVIDENAVTAIKISCLIIIIFVSSFSKTPSDKIDLKYEFFEYSQASLQAFISANADTNAPGKIISKQ